MKLKFLFVLTLVFVMSSFAFAQSPAGKWTGEMPGGRGGANPVVFEFTVAGTTLNGTITVGTGMATPITAGTIAGDTITFQAPAGGGGGGRGGGGGAAAGGAPPAGGGAPPAAAAGAPPAAGGGGGGGQGGGGGRGGGGLATYTGKVTATEIAFSRVGGGGGGGGRGAGGPGGGAPGGAPAGGAPPAAGAAPAPGGAPAAPAPVTFTVKKG